MSMSAHPPPPQRLILYLFLVAAAASTIVSATDHIVGANRGWNPGLNYTLWERNQTFYVGDFISFRYQKTQYNVFEVNQTGYDNCTIEGATGNWSSGKDFILLTKAQRYYFICGNGGCLNGMKVTVRVHPLPSAAAGNSSSTKSGAAATTCGSILVVASLMGIMSILFGSGWI